MSDTLTEPVYKFRSDDAELFNDCAFSFKSYIVHDDEQNTFIDFTTITKWFGYYKQRNCKTKRKNIYVVGEDVV